MRAQAQLAELGEADRQGPPSRPARMSIAGFVTDTVAIGRILEHLGLSMPEAAKPPPVREVLRVAEQECVAWIEKQAARYREDGYGYWLAVEKARGIPVGQVGLMKTKIEGRVHVALGYIIHAPYWQKGYAKEASAACVAYAFERLGERRVVALVRPENAPSMGVARRLGMIPGRTVDFAGLRHIVFAIRRPGRARPTLGRSLKTASKPAPPGVLLDGAPAGGPPLAAGRRFRDPVAGDEGPPTRAPSRTASARGHVSAGAVGARRFSNGRAKTASGIAASTTASGLPRRTRSTC